MQAWLLGLLLAEICKKIKHSYVFYKSLIKKKIKNGG